MDRGGEEDGAEMKLSPRFIIFYQLSREMSLNSTTAIGDYQRRLCVNLILEC